MIKHQRRTFASTLIASLALLALLVFAAMQMAKGVGDIRNGAASEKWPAVSGFVTHAEMQKTRRRRGSSYHAHVQYSYAVAGQSFTGDRIDFNRARLSETEAQALLNRYPDGTAVMVHYDPANASASVLKPGTAAATYVWTGLAAAIATVCAIALIFRVRRLVKTAG